MQLAPAVPTEEQLEWLEKEGFIKDEEEEEGDKDGEEGGAPKKRKVCYSTQCAHPWPALHVNGVRSDGCGGFCVACCFALAVSHNERTLSRSCHRRGWQPGIGSAVRLC